MTVEGGITRNKYLSQKIHNMDKIDYTKCEPSGTRRQPSSSRLFMMAKLDALTFRG